MANNSTWKVQNASKRSVARSPKCARCRNHGFIVQLKGHSGKCQFVPCKCWKCSLISERTKIMATQRRIKKSQKQDTLSVEIPKTASRAAEAGTCGSSADLRPIPDKIERCSSVNGDVLSDNRYRTDSVIKTPVHRTEVDGKTYAELEVPMSSSWGTSDLRRRPNEQTEDGARQSIHSYYWKGGREDAVFRDPPQFPWEYVTTEMAPKNMCSSEILAMPLPIHMHSFYPNGYAYPAFLVSLCAPPPGAYKEAVGFPHLPPGTVACSPENGAPQDGPMPFYASPPPHFFGRGEVGPLPHDYRLSHRDSVPRM